MTTRIHPASSLIIAMLASTVAACSSLYPRDTHGTAATDTKGMTLYTFDKDHAGNGKSACYGDCATQWPPVPVTAVSGTGDGSIQREDGSTQATRENRPLYYFAGDAKPGEAKGDGIGGVWHITPSTDGKAPAKRRAYSSPAYNY